MKSFAGINLSPITLEESLRKVESFIDTGNYHYQISLNAAKVVEAQKDKKLLTIINNADILNADGVPIKIITQFLCKGHTSRLGGLDYMDGLAARHPSYNYYFLGSTDNAVKKTVEYYQDKYHLNVVGWRNGYFDCEEEDAIINEINSKGTDVLYVALGTPAKEYFIYNHRNKLKCKLAVGVGGAFNIRAGIQKRAPKLIQHLGLEWFYRTIQEPKRMWHRYLVGNSRFIWLVVLELFKRKA